MDIEEKRKRRVDNTENQFLLKLHCREETRVRRPNAYKEKKEITNMLVLLQGTVSSGMPLRD